MTRPPNHESFDGHWPEVDESAFVHRSAVLIGKIKIGAESSVWPHTTIRADDGRITIGARTSIQDGSVVHLTNGLSHTVVGDQVTVGHRVILHGCEVEDGCLIGMGAIILDNARIGAQSLVGAGALVTQNKVIPPRSLVLGSPAKVVRQLTDEEVARLDLSWQAYVHNGRLYKDKDKE